MIAVEELLQPVSPEAPCGEDRSYHPSLQELESLAKGKPETQMGDSKIEAQEADWKEVRKLALEFLKASKHLRVGVILTLAQLKLEGLAGFRDGLRVLEGFVKNYWANVYPKLDPEDNNDPTERMNILKSLAAPFGTFGDEMRFIETLRLAAICQSARGMKVTLSDVLAARGGGSPAAEGGGKPGPNATAIEGAFRDTEKGALTATYEAVTQAQAAVKSMDEFLIATVGAGRAANFDELHNALNEIARSLAPIVAPGEAPAEGAAGPEEDAEGAAVAGGGPPRRKGFEGSIDSRADVVKALESVVDYYKRSEPSSPIPFLIKRAQRLVNMDFMQIVNDLTPDSMKELKVITGATDENPPAES